MLAELEKALIFVPSKLIMCGVERPTLYKSGLFQFLKGAFLSYKKAVRYLCCALRSVNLAPHGIDFDSGTLERAAVIFAPVENVKVNATSKDHHARGNQPRHSAASSHSQFCKKGHSSLNTRLKTRVLPNGAFTAPPAASAFNINQNTARTGVSHLVITSLWAAGNGGSLNRIG